MKRQILIRVIACLLLFSFPDILRAESNPVPDPNDVTPAIFDHCHLLWDRVLKEFVVTTGAKSAVRYSSLKAHPKDMQDYLNGIALVDESRFKRFSREEKLAFLINAYNAYTVALIVNNYPISSIKKIE